MSHSRSRRPLRLVLAGALAAAVLAPAVPSPAATRGPTRIPPTTRAVATNGFWGGSTASGAQLGFTVTNGRAIELFGTFPMACRYSDGTSLANNLVVARSNGLSLPVASNGRGRASLNVKGGGSTATLAVTLDLRARRATVGVLSAPPGSGQRCEGTTAFTIARGTDLGADYPPAPDVAIDAADGGQIGFGWNGSLVSNFRARVKLSCSGGGPDGEILALGRDEFPDVAFDDASQMTAQVVERNGHRLEVSVLISLRSRSASVSVISADGQAATCTGSVSGTF